MRRMSPSRHPIGVSSTLFRGSPAAVAEACRRLGLTCVRLAPGFPGMPFHEPAHFTAERCRAAAGPFLDAGVSVACLPATGNLMDSHLSRRQRTVQRLHALLRHARDFGTPYVVTETGTLSPDGRAGPYPPDRTAPAWTELRLLVRLAVEVAADHGATLLLRAEPGHVLASTEDVMRLAARVDDPQLGFVIDPATALMGHPREEWAAALGRLAESVGPRAPVAYAKDLHVDDSGVSLPRAGLGRLDYRTFLRLLDRGLRGGPFIGSPRRPAELPPAGAFLVACLSPVSRPPRGGPLNERHYGAAPVTTRNTSSGVLRRLTAAATSLRSRPDARDNRRSASSTEAPADAGSATVTSSRPAFGAGTTDSTTRSRSRSSSHSPVRTAFNVRPASRQSWSVLRFPAGRPPRRS